MAKALSESQLRLIAAIRAVPRGRVASYSQIASNAGLPGRARLVGRTLGEAPASLKLPWYRILRADGRIALTPGSAGFDKQVRWLTREGVVVHNGKVALAQFGWQRSLDELLWGPPTSVKRKT
jgi:methylated-DNA-protein-cysteine methyltransferase related protein